MGIAITPLSITVDDEVFRDGVDITPQIFFHTWKQARAAALEP